MFEQSPMPNNVKEQTAPGVKKQKRFQAEGERRKDEQDASSEQIGFELDLASSDRETEETLVIEFAEKLKATPEQLVKMRKNIERLFECAIIAGDEETAYQQVAIAFRYHLPYYRDLRENFLKFAKIKLLKDNGALGKERRLRLEKLLTEAESGQLRFEEEKPEIGFEEEEVNPYGETAVQIAPPTLPGVVKEVVREVVREVVKEVVIGEETDLEVRSIVIEQTPTLFAQAIAEECEVTAFMQLLHAKRYKLPQFSAMKQRFIQFVEYLLNEPDENIGKQRKTTLERLKLIVEKQTEVDVFPPRKLSPEERERSKKEAERFQYENTPILFQWAIERKDVLWAYEHLKKAYAMEMPEYEKMRDHFMSLVGVLMHRGYSYYEELLKDPTYTRLPSYEKFKDWLKEVAEDVIAEKFVL